MLITPARRPPAAPSSSIRAKWTRQRQRVTSTANADNTLSYGEYVLSTHGINFEPFVQRAENLADDHGRSLSQDGHIEIIRREWLSIAESNLVVVMLYYRMRSEMRSRAALT